MHETGGGPSAVDPRQDFCVSLGSGRKNTRATPRPIDTDDRVASLLACLDAVEPQRTDAGGLMPEDWWSPHIWSLGTDGARRRQGRNWLAAHCAALDLDFVDPHRPRGQQHVEVGAEQWATLALLASDGDLPATNILHATPRGARLVTVWSRPVTDPIEQLLAQVAVSLQVTDACSRHGVLAISPEAGHGGHVRAGFEVDPQALHDLARFFFTPRAIVGGIQRAATLIAACGEPFDPAELASTVPAEIADTVRRALDGSASVTDPVVVLGDAGCADPDFREAADRWSEAHPIDLPRSGGTCPMCGHTGCFGRLPENPAKWACFSANHHPDSGGIGREMSGYPNSGCGDAADLEAARRGVSVRQLLMSEGYLSIGSAINVDLDGMLRAQESRQRAQAEGGHTTTNSNSAQSMHIRIDDAQPDKPHERELRVKIEPVDAALDVEPPLPLIDGILHREEIGTMSGAPGTGKTFVAMSLALSVATGTPWLGCAVPEHGARVLYMASEGRYGLGNRIRAWCGGEVGDRSKLANWRQTTDLVPFIFGEFNDLIEALKAESELPQLIVVDTLALAMTGGDENSAKDMGLFVRRCKELRDLTGAAVLLIHHTGKSGEAAKSERGSGALKGACDVMLMLEKRDAGYVELTSTKVKDRAALEPLRIDLVEVDLGNGRSSLRAQQMQAGQRPKGIAVGAEMSGRLVVLETLKQALRDDRTGELVWITTAELRAGTGLSRSQVHRIVKQLQDEDLIIVQSAGNRTNVQLRPDRVAELAETLTPAAPD